MTQRNHYKCFRFIFCLTYCIHFSMASDMLIIRHGRSRVRHSTEKNHIRWGLQAFDNLTLDYDYDNDTMEMNGGNQSNPYYVAGSEMFYLNSSSGGGGVNSAERTYGTSYSNNPFDYQPNNRTSSDYSSNSTINNSSSGGGSSGVVSVKAITSPPQKKKIGKKEIMENIRKNVDKGLEYLKSHAHLNEENIEINTARPLLNEKADITAINWNAGVVATATTTENKSSKDGVRRMEGDNIMGGGNFQNDDVDDHHGDGNDEQNTKNSNSLNYSNNKMLKKTGIMSSSSSSVSSSSLHSPYLPTALALSLEMQNQTGKDGSGTNRYHSSENQYKSDQDIMKATNNKTETPITATATTTTTTDVPLLKSSNPFALRKDKQQLSYKSMKIQQINSSVKNATDINNYVDIQELNINRSGKSDSVVSAGVGVVVSGVAGGVAGGGIGDVGDYNGGDTVPSSLYSDNGDSINENSEIPMESVDFNESGGEDYRSALHRPDDYADLEGLDETSRNNRMNLMKGRDVVTRFLQIVETQHLLGSNCTAGTALNLGEGVVDRYAHDRFRVEAEVAVNRANMLTR